MTGTAIHRVTLEPHLPRPFAGTKKMREDETIALACSRAVHAHAFAGPLVRGAAKEVTLRWQDKETGLEVKARLDTYDRPRAIVGDLKSTNDAGPWAFAGSIAKFRYHVQCALYLEGLRVLGEPPRRVGVDRRREARERTAARRDVRPGRVRPRAWLAPRAQEHADAGRLHRARSVGILPRAHHDNPQCPDGHIPEDRK